ncbi:MAG TPA: Zn-dependent alcohol dehydrogenase [Solirubrobacteraceae bacterium]|nr:Zn-dependent alcohol dehydrogenase [Solirubrobacteraceae bacterium]
MQEQQSASAAAAARFQGRTARAAVLRAPGRPLEVQELEVSEPGAEEVLVRLVASGVCHSDYHVQLGEWAAPMPIVLGHEGAGVVAAVGERVQGLQVGDSVVLSWSPSCRRCEWCVSGRPQLCSQAEAFAYRSVMADGTTRLRRGDEAVHAYLALGTFGEYAVVHESAAIRVAGSVALEAAALVGCAVATGFGAVVNTARVPAGASVAIIGCGGVGLSAVQGARATAAGPIIAVDLHDEKLDLARSLGATHGVHAGREDPVAAVRAITGGRGVDFALEAIGLPRAIEQAVEMLAAGGSAVLVGQAPDDSRISVDPLRISDRELRIIGCNYGSCRPPVDFPRLLDLCARGVIDLEAMISRRIGLEDVNHAFAAMGAGEGLRSVIVYGD